MRIAKLIGSLVATGVLATAGTAQWKRSDQVNNLVETTLTQVRAYPDAFRNVKIRFDVQFATLGSISNPFFTEFVPTDYANFHAWASEQPIWQRNEFDDLFGLLFIGKANDQLEDLYNAKTFDRLRCTAMVRNTFQGQPWIEVISFEEIAESVEWATLSHLYRADQAMVNRDWKRAIAELGLASQAENPNDVAVQIEKNLGICYLRMGEQAAAARHLTEAKTRIGKALDPELEHMLRAMTDDPAKELDRVVKAAELREFERPLWEAFEGDAGGDRQVRPQAPR